MESPVRSKNAKAGWFMLPQTAVAASNFTNDPGPKPEGKAKACEEAAKPPAPFR